MKHPTGRDDCKRSRSAFPGPGERLCSGAGLRPDGITIAIARASQLRGMTIQAGNCRLGVVNERDDLCDDVPFDYPTSVAEAGVYGGRGTIAAIRPRGRQSARRPRRPCDVPDVLFPDASAPLKHRLL